MEDRSVVRLRREGYHKDSTENGKPEVVRLREGDNEVKIESIAGERRGESIEIITS